MKAEKKAYKNLVLKCGQGEWTCNDEYIWTQDRNSGTSRRSYSCPPAYPYPVPRYCIFLYCSLSTPSTQVYSCTTAYSCSVPRYEYIPILRLASPVPRYIPVPQLAPPQFPGILLYHSLFLPSTQVYSYTAACLPSSEVYSCTTASPSPVSWYTPVPQLIPAQYPGIFLSCSSPPQFPGMFLSCSLPPQFPGIFLYHS